MPNLLKWALKPIGFLILVVVKIYQYVVSPLWPASCRYSPTCSAYMVEAIKVHGPFAGFWMGLKRIGRCHPWGGYGWDPVPGSEADKHSH